MPSSDRQSLIAVPGYGDRTTHLQFLRQLRGVDLHIVPFGSTEDPERYEELYEIFSQKCQEIGQAAIVGFSFGGAAIRRYVSENPDLANTTTTVASPVLWDGFERDYVDDKYPMLTEVLDYNREHGLTANPIIDRAYYFGRDNTVPQSSSIDMNSKMIEIPHLGHGTGILYACINARKLF